MLRPVQTNQKAPPPLGIEKLPPQEHMYTSFINWKQSVSFINRIALHEIFNSEGHQWPWTKHPTSGWFECHNSYVSQAHIHRGKPAICSAPHALIMRSSLTWNRNFPAINRTHQLQPAPAGGGSRDKHLYRELNRTFSVFAWFTDLPTTIAPRNTFRFIDFQTFTYKKFMNCNYRFDMVEGGWWWIDVELPQFRVLFHDECLRSEEAQGSTLVVLANTLVNVLTFSANLWEQSGKAAVKNLTIHNTRACGKGGANDLIVERVIWGPTPNGFNVISSVDLLRNGGDSGVQGMEACGWWTTVERNYLDLYDGIDFFTLTTIFCRVSTAPVSGRCMVRS